ncbi:flagellar biosynthesis anti-sigma factor FlgM [Sphingopyxis sp. Geo48]|jgi:negative regulator of flagellin synthesis FlgM|uniref:flagellar biosynthesis anti-sigma factor FlgM n=1 Tax=Sphingopyxis sp. Geo48 TaxID=545241 RepID=UPI00195F55F2|nr:flagellar biosynthesis anti-sigma factor FlgM [Sphingopyxis sp. Geo48]
MSSDGKIGQVGGVSRTAPVRKIADSTLAAGATPLRTAAPDALAGASLIRIASDLASMPPPVDSARVASLRTAINQGGYRVDAATIALAMLNYAQGRTE